MATQALSKPDCVRLQKSLLGIVAEGLSQDDALGIQAGLRTQGIETEVVSESNLPSLPTPYRPLSFAVTGEGVAVTDYTGRDRLFPMATFVFAAGGYVKHLVNLPQRKMEWVQKPVDGSGIRDVVEMVTERELKEVQEFRIEFYFTQEPFRLQNILDGRTFIRANGEILKLRDRNQLAALLLNLANTMPPDQTNLGIRKVAVGEDFTYPSLHAFETEIVWSLYRMAHPPG